MRYIKTQESFFKNIFKKKNILPEELINLFNSIINLFNEIFNQKLIYKQKDVYKFFDNGFLYTIYEIKFYADNMTEETHIFSIQYYDSFKNNNYIKFDFGPEWITTKYEIFVEFLIIIASDFLNQIYINDIQTNITDNINKDEYEIFLLKKTTDKYGL